VDAAEIWQTIVKADELLKYATEDKAQVRRDQAVVLLRKALSEAQTGKNAQLAEQARTRLHDLGLRD
jgi:hypothetical protein